MKYETPHRGLTWLQWYNKHKVWHPGWDFNFGLGDDDLGASVVSFENGIIEYVSPVPSKLNNYNGGFGWFVIIEHPALKVWSRYAHLKKVTVKQGETISEGEQIGECGNSGTTWAHLHWEVFNLDCYSIQTSHWRKFGHYPSGKTKEWVMSHYVDGLELISQINAKNNSAKEWYRVNFPELFKSSMTESECEQWRTFAKRLLEWSK